MNFNDYVTLTTGVPATITELIIARIAQWTMSAVGAENTALKADEVSRWRARTVASCIIRPEGDILTMRAHRGLRNCAVIAASIANIVADMANAEPIAGGAGVKNLNSTGPGNEVEICNRVLYQASGGDVKVWLDVTVN